MPEVRLGLVVPGDHVEVVARLHELEQPVGLSLNELFLLGRQHVEGEGPLVLYDVGQDGAELHVAQAGGVLGERGVADLAQLVVGGAPAAS